MEEHDCAFIEVDLSTFEIGRYDILVVNGIIKSLTENIISKLVVTTEQSVTAIRCDPTDVTLVVDKNQQHIFWDYKMLQ